MVKILGTGTTTDGKEYVMVDEEDFKELRSAKLLVDFARKHGKESRALANLFGGTSPKDLDIGDGGENSFYKLRDWTKVEI
jgi:hypothetical protein